MDTTCSTLSILLNQTSGRLQVPLAQACALVGLSSKTWRNRASEGRPPFPSTMPPRRVDLRDLADFIDTRRPVAPQPPSLQQVVEEEKEESRVRRGKYGEDAKARAAASKAKRQAAAAKARAARAAKLEGVAA